MSQRRIDQISGLVGSALLMVFVVGLGTFILYKLGRRVSTIRR